MIRSSLLLYQGLKDNNLKIYNTHFNALIQDYCFLYVTEKSEIKEIDQNIKESQNIIINQYKELNNESDDKYFIICFQKTILIINQTSKSLLCSFFKLNPKAVFCFLSDTKPIFSEIINCDFKEFEINEQFSNEILKIDKQLIIHHLKGKLKQAWSIIRSCISAYLLKQSYNKLNKNRINDFTNNSDKDSKNRNINSVINDNELVYLRQLGIGSISCVELFYYIKKQELVAVKWQNQYDDNNSTLKKREIDNYTNISHPLLPTFYGITKKQNLVIEYINGRTLGCIAQMNLTENDKFKIIFELMITVEYLHRKHYVFRDLKPDNVMIDENKNAVLFDFDRMIKIDGIQNSTNNNFTQSFSSNFIAPEVNSGEYNYSCDIYSIGMMIFFIMTEKEPNEENFELYLDFGIHEKLLLLMCKCVNEPDDRKSICKLIFVFYINYYNLINLNDFFTRYEYYYNKMYDERLLHILKTISLPDNSEALYEIGLLYEEGYFFKENNDYAIEFYTLAADKGHLQSQLKVATNYASDYETKIKYYTLAANQNDINAMFELADLYMSRKTEVSKMIHYYKMAADRGHLTSQFDIATIYDAGIYVERDVSKAIYYYMLASNQNHAQSQYMLGCFYESNEDIPRDMKKAIEYFTLSANQEYAQAQSILGRIYQKGKGTHVDIDKAIYYYMKASNQNDVQSQFNLGSIFEEEKYGKKDIDKAITYYTLAANNGYEPALMKLGSLYESKDDIQNSIKYYSMAANRNNSSAQYELGLIYLKHSPCDVDKAIYYLQCSTNQGNNSAKCVLGEIYLTNEYVPRDIKKSIYYYTLAAEQNDASAQYNLGVIYSYGQYIPRDISRAIYYLTLSANQNFTDAYFLLGLIYEDGKIVSRQIDLAIHYFEQAAKQNHPIASFQLGLIYGLGINVPVDLNQAIFYYSAAAKYNVPEALYNLALLYLQCQKGLENIEEAIYNLTVASMKNNAQSQYLLGVIYYFGYDIPKNINRGIYWLQMSSKNRFKEAFFKVGFIYHEGKDVEQNILEALHQYKEGSSLNDQYAKNNLGVIIKNGFSEQVKKDISFAIDVFTEAIRQKNDSASIHNLASIYLYEQPFENSIDESINLLVQAEKNIGYLSHQLLCMALIKKYGANINTIKNEIDKLSESISLSTNICSMIIRNDYLNKDVFEKQYKHYQTIDLLYDFSNNIISSTLMMKDIKEDKKIKDISDLFYDGFDIQ